MTMTEAERHAAGINHDRRACGLCCRTCAWCGDSRPVELLERVNNSDARACIASTSLACEMRQAGMNPAYELGRVLRSLAAEVGVFTTQELAELDYDLNGPRGEILGGFAGAVSIHLSARDDSAANIAAVAADRLARKR